MKRDDIKVFVLRMPMSLYEQVKKESEEGRLTVTRFIINKLKSESIPELPETKIKALEQRIEALERIIREGTTNVYTV